MTAALHRLLPLLVALFLALHGSSPPSVSADGLRVSWEPAQPRTGDVVLMRVHGAPRGALVDATIDGHPVIVFPSGPAHAGLVGVDMEARPGPRRWQVTVKAADGVQAAEGELAVVARTYEVQRLTLAQTMVELDPATERRVHEQAERLRALYRLITGERLWRGHWVRPVAGDAPGHGFGARRVINGQPRAPHGGTDFSAPTGTPVVAANRGRVALAGEFLFPGRFVILDHGLGLYTVYFHLDTVAVTTGQLVTRGEALGTVGMTGRVTGPHLHFGAQVGAARVDPDAVLGLAPGDEGRD